MCKALAAQAVSARTMQLCLEGRRRRRPGRAERKDLLRGWRGADRQADLAWAQPRRGCGVVSEGRATKRAHPVTERAVLGGRSRPDHLQLRHRMPWHPRRHARGVVVGHEMPRGGNREGEARDQHTGRHPRRAAAPEKREHPLSNVTPVHCAPCKVHGAGAGRRVQGVRCGCWVFSWSALQNAEGGAGFSPPSLGRLKPAPPTAGNSATRS